MSSPPDPRSPEPERPASTPTPPAATGSAQGPHFPTADSLLPAIAQDATSGTVLMVAFMNRAAWDETVASGEAVYFSRSRNRLWKKGEHSGHTQRVVEIRLDCDRDAILLRVNQQGGAACHQGYESCFFRRYDQGTWRVDLERRFDPQQVYDSTGTT